jgi:phosphoribosylaminoimidazolecarboxamide formyltransferase/IMP cyclohydrolase
MIKIKRALISVSDKKNVVELAKLLASADVEILSTGGTAKLLRENKIPVVEVAEYTNFPEMLGGRVKTLHPRIHGGILGVREDKEHIKTMQENDIPPIDLVVVNLYPFEKTIQNPDCTLEEAIENIDIGGPTMIRAAAKNYQSVAILTNPDDYSLLAEKLANKKGILSKDFLFNLSKKAFLHTAEYDAAISKYLHKDSDENFPNLKVQVLHKKLDMRYGENPHQKAAFYCDKNLPNSSLSNFSQLHGKELSFNNLNDANNAWECVKSFNQPTCVIVKHANPCGVCSASTTSKAYLGAFATDPTSAFGGIIAFNKEINEETALLVMNQFVEVVIAPGFSDKAIQIFKNKDNLRLLSVPIGPEIDLYDFKKISGGWLVQSTDDHKLNLNECEVVSKLKPTKKQMEDMLFAWKVAQFVKSNAIVFCNKGQTLGVGAGQMSRIDSTKIAGIKAQNAGLSLKSSVVASDAFFPFRDGVDELAKYGAKCVIQPGGSLRDKEVIEAANEHGLVMIFTKIRHFKH